MAFRGVVPPADRCQSSPRSDPHSKIFSEGGLLVTKRWLLIWRSRCLCCSVVWGKMEHLCHNDLHFKLWDMIRFYCSAIMTLKRRLVFGLWAEFGSANSRHSCLHFWFLDLCEAATAAVEVCVHGNNCLHWFVPHIWMCVCLCVFVCAFVWDPGEIMSSDNWVEHSILTV